MADISLKSVECAIYQCQTENTVVIDRPGESDTVSGESRETHARVVWLISHQNDCAVTQASGLFDAALHKFNADAAATLIGLNRQRSKQERGLCADENGPEADRTPQDLVLDCDEAQRALGFHALAQAVGRFCEAPRPEHFRHERRDSRLVARLFRPDVPIFGFAAHVSSA
jgi:hypothetical protein